MFGQNVLFFSSYLMYLIQNASNKQRSVELYFSIPVLS